MPDLPRVHRPAYVRPEKPFVRSRTERSRLSGRALQTRNERIKVRDGYRCYVCNRVTDEGQVDHKVPLAQGGTEDDDNCGWICITPCHRDKSRREAIAGKR